MALPETIRVKISSEAAEALSLTPVVVRDMPVRELVEAMLGVSGKNAARIRDLLRRGAFVSGASRFRWQPMETDEPGIAALLATFPDPEPARPFAAGACVRVALKTGSGRIEISREAARERRMFQRECFWDALMQLASEAPRYSGYSYKERADQYTAELSQEAAARLRESAGLIRYSALERSVRQARIEAIVLFVERR